LKESDGAKTQEEKRRKRGSSPTPYSREFSQLTEIEGWKRERERYGQVSAKHPSTDPSSLAAPHPKRRRNSEIKGANLERLADRREEEAAADV